MSKSRKSPANRAPSEKVTHRVSSEKENQKVLQVHPTPIPPQLRRLGSVDSVIGALRFEAVTPHPHVGPAELRETPLTRIHSPNESYCKTPFAPVHLSLNNTLILEESRKRRRRLGSVSSPERFGDGHLRFHADYTEIALLGKGSTSEVFRARHKLDDCLYAIKRSLPVGLTRARTIDQCIQEARILATLLTASETGTGAGYSGSKNIIRYTTSFIEEQRFFLVTELCDMSARDAYCRFGAFKQDVLLDFVADLGKALAFCHDQGVVHLDVSPGNVFLAKGRRFKLGDFGLAIFVSPSSHPLGFQNGGADSGVPSGDARYLAPEVLRGKVDDIFKIDIFALGASTLACASGADLPAEGEAWERLRRVAEDPAVVTEYLSEVSEEVAEIVTAMLQTDASKRPTAEELIQSDWLKCQDLEVSMRE